jgi:hypothetical protein
VDVGRIRDTVAAVVVVVRKRNDTPMVAVEAVARRSTAVDCACAVA